MIYLIICLIVLLILAGIYLYKRNKNVKQEPTIVADDCCGAHAVCEKNSLLANSPKIVYYDDEELDYLAGVPIGEMENDDVQAIENVFFTLQEKDVAGWLKSLQLRNIELPVSIRDEALLIISERRSKQE